MGWKEEGWCQTDCLWSTQGVLWVVYSIFCLLPSPLSSNFYFIMRSVFYVCSTRFDSVLIDKSV